MRGRPVGRPAIPGYITEQEQASRSGVTVATLRRWRVKGYGPRAVHFGRVPMYREDANEQFLVQKEATAEAQRKLRPRGRPRASSGSTESSPPFAARGGE
jgi:hypothetical protein